MRQTPRAKLRLHVYKQAKLMHLILYTARHNIFILAYEKNYTRIYRETRALLHSSYSSVFRVGFRVFRVVVPGVPGGVPGVPDRVPGVPGRVPGVPGGVPGVPGGFRVFRVGFRILQTPKQNYLR